MKNVVVGLAGHIDHGKTALVKALTGIDADRLEEEKRRGITIDLGFAHLRLTPSLQVGFVDVPGHERFVKNMLAGVGGIDLLLFVVAANESVKPQTREHFEICRLLGIRGGIVALTKADLVDEEILGLVRLEVEELTAGSFLDGAPVVPVSSTAGTGLDELRAELERCAAAAPARDCAGHFRLPVDRVFSVKGFGVVATGTLISGSVAKGDEVEIYPSGRRARVRGLQAYGSAAGRAEPGQRTAVNLSDLEVADLRRGDVLSEPARFHPAAQVDCRLELLASAKPLKHRAPVHFHSGTAEIEAEVRLLEGAGPLPPGSTAWVRIALREPALLLPGDRFIIRMFSPVTTIGGGLIVDIGGKRYRKGEDVGGRLAVLASPDVAARIALLVREAPHGIGSPDLVARTGLSAHSVAEAAATAGLVSFHEPPWYVDPAWFQSARDRLAQAVRDFHDQHPLVPGMAREDLRSRQLPGAPPFVFDALVASAADLISEGEIVRARTHRVALKEDEERARALIENAFESAGLATPTVSEVMARTGLEPARARALLAILLRERKLVRISDELVFHRSSIDRLRAMLRERKSVSFQVSEFKDWTGISRKYAIPLLEYLDRERITRREGDRRVVL